MKNREAVVPMCRTGSIYRYLSCSLAHCFVASLLTPCYRLSVLSFTRNVTDHPSVTVTDTRHCVCFPPQERSRSRASTAAERLPTGPTCALTCKRTRRWRSISVRAAWRPSPGSRCWPSTRRRAAPCPDSTRKVSLLNDEQSLWDKRPATLSLHTLVCGPRNPLVMWWLIWFRFDCPVRNYLPSYPSVYKVFTTLDRVTTPKLALMKQRQMYVDVRIAPVAWKIEERSPGRTVMESRDGDPRPMLLTSSDGF